MGITKLKELWEAIDNDLPRDVWIPLQDIYTLVDGIINFKPDDFHPSASNTSEPKWRRNVRNVLQHRKETGDIAWNKNGHYMILSRDLEVSGDGVIQNSQYGERKNIIEEEFRRLLESRRAIGLAGEKWAVEYERERLITRGKNPLAKRVQRISETNVAAGYDILSFTSYGEEKYIEVKTTALSKRIFYISSNELETSKKLQRAYWIYFIVEIFGKPQLLPIQNPHNKIGTMLKLMPTNYRVEIEA